MLMRYVYQCVSYIHDIHIDIDVPWYLWYMLIVFIMEKLCIDVITKDHYVVLMCGILEFNMDTW